MKFKDDVMVIRDREKYKKLGITKGMIGYIVFPEIRYNGFAVCFIDEMWSHEDVPENYEYKDDIFALIKIEDLELLKDNKCSDERILNSIPLHNKEWWCKVEDGYIMNLLGEKKNKIPYDYDS